MILTMVTDNELNPVLGIDLGTTFSSIARWDGRGPRVYQTKTGPETLQSVVYYNPQTQEILVGDLAYHRGLVNPENMAFGVKRYMDDAHQNLLLGGQKFSPIELSSLILKRLYNDVTEKSLQSFHTSLEKLFKLISPIQQEQLQYQVENEVKINLNNTLKANVNSNLHKKILRSRVS